MEKGTLWSKAASTESQYSMHTFKTPAAGDGHNGIAFEDDVEVVVW